MTSIELENTPVFSQVKYQQTIAVILKIKNGSAILWDSTQGWISYPIPASELTLVSKYIAQGGTPSNFASAPLYCKVYVNGKEGYLIEKRETPNQFTGETMRTGLVWYMDTETFDWFDQSVIAFSSGGTIPGGGTQPSSLNKILLYGGIGYLAYMMFKPERTTE